MESSRHASRRCQRLSFASDDPRRKLGGPGRKVILFGMMQDICARDSGVIRTRRVTVRISKELERTPGAAVPLRPLSHNHVEIA